MASSGHNYFAGRKADPDCCAAEPAFADSQPMEFGWRRLVSRGLVAGDEEVGRSCQER
ncbi:MAG TPA: hypothetical protein VHU88_08760 [Sporichthyaceae bacterium]|nr:hypothetical protein [Sporichthyaceae bacterium]